DKNWKFHIGVVTNLLEQIEINPDQTIVMMCGPEIMMHFAIKEFLNRKIPTNQIYLSMERNMKCALGFCGHCQYGPHFICRDGPILRYDQVAGIFPHKEI
ncbi:MAG: Ni/Fe hydrogenase subunit gamma, partial [bacterium]|nr:Ni/Fe hydrogenase subunit gamma [bacterium]